MSTLNEELAHKEDRLAHIDALALIREVLIHKNNLPHELVVKLMAYETKYTEV